MFPGPTAEPVMQWNLYMNENKFHSWLCEKYTGRTANSRLSNCLRVEEYEGSLDDHFVKDKGSSLLQKLTYSKNDQHNNRKPSHKIPIAGNIYNGTATLKQAVSLYFKYKAGNKHNETNGQAAPIQTGKRNKNLDWPVWDYPSDQELYELIKLTVKYTKYLHPEIVRKVVQDNNKHTAKWSEQLERRKIPSKIYLWENSPCAFPGVRRYAGSQEIAFFRKHTKLSDSDIKYAIRLDDNDYPKHIWSYLFRKTLNIRILF